ncbi:MAG: HesA/MoeB/ThiF family protein [Proteobacteria bacterium]|nr:HesA/MoeB/ThiF family protein [Pseudomonadota bacterium]
MGFTEDEKLRYKQHLVLENFGTKGQKKISRAKILVIGAGGLGSPALLYLAAAGIGTLGIADPDSVDISNLQRQVLYTTADIGEKKVIAAKRRIHDLNPDINIICHEFAIGYENITHIIERYDFIIDGTDNFSSKFLINDACVSIGKPFVHAGVVAYEGQAMTIVPGQSACYRCVFRNPPPSELKGSEQLGILGPIPGILGAIQATEAIKFMLGKGRLLLNHLLIYNAFDMTTRTVRVKQRKDCPACSG